MYMVTQRIGRCRTLLAGIAAMAALMGVAPGARAAAGDLDSTFGTAGVALTPVGDYGDGAYGIVKQPSDGKYVVVGVGAGGVTDVVRYLPSGQADTSFGTNGIVTLSPPSGVFIGYAIALDGNGRIIIAGNWSTTTGQGFGVVRLSASNGAVDSTFGTSGWTQTMLGDSATAFGAAVAIDGTSGNIYVGGAAEQSGHFDFALTGYDSSGSLLSGFGSGGSVLTDVAGGNAQINAIALDGDKIVAAGQAINGLNGNTEAAVIRYGSDGNVDSTFHSGTAATVLLGGATVSGARAVLIGSSHTILIGGWANTATGNEFALRRFTSAGATDTSFGTGGETLTSIGSLSTIEALGVNGDGLYAGGVTSDGSGNDKFALARYTADGALDASFHSGGTVTSSPVSGQPAGANAMLLDGSEPVLAGGVDSGQTGTQFALERFQGGGGSPPQPTADPGHRPTISGTASPGRTLSGTPGGWTGTTHYVYEWLRCPTAAIPPVNCAAEQLDDLTAASDTYAVQQGDTGSYIILEVKGVNAAGAYNVAYSAPERAAAAPVPPANRAHPSVQFSGSQPRVGDQFRADAGTWSGTQPITYSYGWLRCPANPSSISQCTGVSTSASPIYTLQQADIGHRMLLAVTAANVAGASRAFSPSYTGVIDDKAGTVHKAASDAHSADKQLPPLPPISNIISKGGANVNIGTPDPGKVIVTVGGQVSGSNNGGLVISPDDLIPPPGGLVPGNDLISDKGLGLISDKGLGAIDRATMAKAGSKHAKPKHAKPRHVIFFLAVHVFHKGGHARLVLRPTKAGRTLLRSYEAQVHNARRHHRKVRPLRIRVAVTIAPVHGKGPAVYDTKVVTVKP